VRLKSKGKNVTEFIERLYIVVHYIKRSTTQFYLQITPYLPLARKRLPDDATTDCDGRHNCSLLLIHRARKDERWSQPSWLTCGGRFTHKVVTRQLLVERRESSPRSETDVLYTTLPRNL